MKISQREARRLRKRVDELEQAFESQRRRWSQEFFGGVEIGCIMLNDMPKTLSAIRTARTLRHAVVAVVNNDESDVRFMALPSPEPR